ncbi:hypothetical protein [Sphingomonas echinoides]|uniref:hypothetical protein n=1 Tax=Sphingomonas echinoides TaxID=59803 RepID=UPI002412F5E3|nr:hypothetical protein [Sphingomonas echinoides]
MQHDAPSLPDAIDTFIAANSMSPVTFGRMAMRDPHFVRDIRGGRRVWPETEAMVRKFMASYRAPAAEREAA